MDKLLRALHEKAALYEAIQRAARDLPDGAGISVHVERGAGWVTLWHYDRDEDTTTIDGADLTLAEQVEDAIELACQFETDYSNGSSDHDQKA